MAQKFKVGDKVVIKRLNPRTPKYIRDAVRIDKTRTVKGTHYDNRTQHIHYYLGKKPGGADITMYPFRANELRLVGRNPGRPREKRKYRYKVV